MGVWRVGSWGFGILKLGVEFGFSLFIVSVEVVFCGYRVGSGFYGTFRVRVGELVLFFRSFVGRCSCC